MDKYGIIIAACVAIVALVGMTLYFSGDMTGAASFPKEPEYRCILDYQTDQLVCETIEFGELDSKYFGKEPYYI